MKNKPRKTKAEDGVFPDPGLPEAVEARLQLYERALDAISIPVCIALADQAQDHPIIYVNSAFESITGYRWDQVIGRNCRFLQRNDHDQPGLEEIRTALSSQEDCRTVLRNYRRNGDMFWNRLFISPLRGDRDVVTHFIGIAEDITQQRMIEASTTIARTEAQFSSTHDALTGLPNRYLLRERLQNALDNACRTLEPLALVGLHLDRFSAINTELGYEVGDQILAVLTERLQCNMGPGTTLGRQGGDEFLLMNSGIRDKVTLSSWCQTLTELVARPLSISQNLRVTASIGAVLVTEPKLSADEVIRRAEQAVRRAKREGRNGFALYQTDLDTQPDFQLLLRSEIHDAIQEGQFLLHYQPQVSCRTQHILGVEALVRWRHPSRGILSPHHFIQVAEDSGHIAALGEWVLQTACCQLSQWMKKGLKPGTMAVNVSATQFSRESFIDSVHRALDNSGIQPQLLELELTESIMFSDVDIILDKLRTLKSLGVSLSLDDFGTGYSSLHYLKRLPIDRLKIDKSFVAGIPDDEHDSAIVKAIIAMARNLKLELVAEGVETPRQLNFLSRHFCDQAQGYYFSPPIAAAGIETMITAQQAHQIAGDLRPTVLLVDDEENVLNALARLFRREQFRLLTARCAEEALTALAEEPVQVILADHAMPGATGIDLLHQVKEKRPEVVRLLITGYPNMPLMANAINDSTVFKFLTKPWNDEELLTTVRQALHYQQSSLDG